MSAAETVQALRIDIVSDAICPWCWIGKRNLEAALDELGWEAEVHWHPYQLNPDMPRAGLARTAYRSQKFGSAERAAQLDVQVTASAAAAGLEFHLDRQHRTPNTVLAHRLARWAADQGVQTPLIEAMFQAYFQDGRDIGDVAVLTGIAAGMGLDAAAFLASDEHEADVLAEDAGFRQMGINGVPSFALAGHILFSGAMPPDQMAAAFRRGAELLRERGDIA